MTQDRQGRTGTPHKHDDPLLTSAGPPLCRATYSTRPACAGPPKISFVFSPLPSQIAFFLLSLGVVFVELWPRSQAMAHPKCAFRVPAVILGELRGHNFTKKTTRERRKNEICDGRGKKARNVGLPALRPASHPPDPSPSGSHSPGPHPPALSPPSTNPRGF